MPIYFSDIAPTCPISRDQPVSGSAGLQRSPMPIRTTIPHAHDFPSAIAAVNFLRQIISQLTVDRVINNLFKAPTVRPGTTRTKNMLKTARWVEQKDKRVKRRYKYYYKDEDGEENKDVWVEMERIERMVWYDKAWKAYMIWEYGEKGEGVPSGSGGG